MALLTTRFVTNYVIAYAPQTKLPLCTFMSGKPQPSADPLYPASNIFIPDRGVRWGYPGPNSAVEVFITLAGSKTVDILGLTGLERAETVYPTRLWANAWNTWPDPSVTSCICSTSSATITRTGGATFPSSIKVGMKVSGTLVGGGRTVIAVVGNPITALLLSSNPANNTTETLTFSDMQEVVLRGVSGVGSLVRGYNDPYYLLPSAVTARYWNVGIEDLPTGAVGSVLIGRTSDLGKAFAAGSSETSEWATVENRAANGSLRSSRVGSLRKKLSYSLPKLTATDADFVRTALLEPTTLVLTPRGELWECALTSSRFTESVVWGDPELYDLQLDLETLQ